MNKLQRTFDVLYFKNPRGEGKEFSHKYSETWEPTEYFCPNCGEKSVWHECSPGDYYVGEQYICLKCGNTFYLPMGVNEANGEQDEQRLEYLRA